MLAAENTPVGLAGLGLFRKKKKKAPPPPPPAAAPESAEGPEGPLPITPGGAATAAAERSSDEILKAAIRRTSKKAAPSNIFVATAGSANPYLFWGLIGGSVLLFGVGLFFFLNKK
jgi:hypothetical protein